MNALAFKRNRQRRLIVVAVLFAAAVLCGRSRSYASCGDYLLHGWPQHNAGMGQHGGGDLGATESTLLNFGDRVTDFQPADTPQPTSPCANGQCHSLPMWPPVNHPSRMIVWKQPATVDVHMNAWPSEFADHWSFPSDGTLPADPLLAVAVPPPRFSLA